VSKLEIRNLTKRFKKVVAVDKLSLSVKDGECVAILGPSGCGKTTALRCIAGLETPDEGEILIDDTVVNNMPPKDRDIAMVFQAHGLYPHMSVYENIALPLEARKVPKEEIRRRIKKAVELLKIQELLDRKPSQISGGQYQRVVIGKVIVRDPKVMLMDEPLSSLDAKLRAYMRAELKRLQQDLGTTTVYVTHDQVEAMTIADRVAVLNQGSLQQYPPPPELYFRPSNQFVAGFIGTPPMNFIPCSLTENRGAFYLDIGADFKVEIERELVELLKNPLSSELILGVRPKDISIHLNKVKESIEGKVYILESLGAETIVDVDSQGSIFKINTTEPGGLKPDQPVWFTFKKEKIYLFDKITGECLC